MVLVNVVVVVVLLVLLGVVDRGVVVELSGCLVVVWEKLNSLWYVLFTVSWASTATTINASRAMFILGNKFVTVQHFYLSIIFLRNDSGNIDLRESIRYARRREAVNYEQSSDWKQQGWQGRAFAIQKYKRIFFINSSSLLWRRGLLVLSRLIELNWYFMPSTK